MPLGPRNAITAGLCLRAWCGSSFWGLWYPCLTACFQVLLFGFDFLKYFLYFNSDPRDLESTPLLFPNKNQTGNKHIASEMVKLGSPSKDTALGLGSPPACVPQSISLEETWPQPCGTVGWKKPWLQLTPLPLGWWDMKRREKLSKQHWWQIRPHTWQLRLPPGNRV